MTDLLGGRIDVASLVLGTAAGQNVRVIGIFAETRHPAFADVPTVKEQGFDVSPISFGGLLAPAGTPAPVLAKLVAGLRRRGEGRGLQDDRPSAPRSRRTTTTTPRASRQRLDRDTAAQGARAGAAEGEAASTQRSPGATAGYPGRKARGVSNAYSHRLTAQPYVDATCWRLAEVCGAHAGLQRSAAAAG